MQTVAMFQALADDTRLRCFRVLALAAARGELLCGAELADIVQKPQYAVSRALAELRKARLVAEQRAGKLVWFGLVPGAAMAELGAWLGRHCGCGIDGPGSNGDGSSLPGGEPCVYDAERLAWRLATRPGRQRVLAASSGGKALRVLFVCVHNSARSQLAEAYVRQLGGAAVEAASAGLEAGQLNPLVVRALAAEGIDISTKQPQAVADVYGRGESYDWVITVCDPEVERNCPVFPGPVQRANWPFADPAAFVGSEAERYEQVRALAVAMRQRVEQFWQEIKE
jgi:arsenate reductase (thioredoxin)